MLHPQIYVTATRFTTFNNFLDSTLDQNHQMLVISTVTAPNFQLQIPLVPIMTI
uniref:Uncharacterized protein n=1 Tax=Rhizophora mucronata TaxID=61149 RepID=A0A2P2JJK8_RHIMU